MPDNWPFEDPPNLRAFTTQCVLQGQPPQFVSHDEDGEWQFHAGPAEMNQAMIVSLGLIVELHPTVTELAALPRGWSASRQSPNDAWVLEDDRPPYTLDSATQANAEFPDTFPIPPGQQRSSLRVGDLVKLMFRIRTPESTVVERMWVCVQEVLPDSTYVGTLANDAHSNPEIREGLLVEFEADHVIQIEPTSRRRQ